MKRLIFLFIPVITFAQAGKFHGQTTAIDADAQTYISAWQTAASLTMQNNIKNSFSYFISGLKFNNFWTKFATGDIAPMYGATSATCAICIKGTTLTFVATPTFNQTGVDWNATTQYARTGWIPSASASTTAAHVSYYSGENSVANDRVVIAVFDGTNYIGLTINTAGGNILGRAYSTSVTATTTTPATKSGFFVVSKESNTSLFVQRNGSTLASNINSNTAARPTKELYIGAQNNNGTPSLFDNRECRYASWGDGFSQADATTYNSLVAELIRKMGR